MTQFFEKMRLSSRGSLNAIKVLISAFLIIFANDFVENIRKKTTSDSGGGLSVSFSRRQAYLDDIINQG